MLTSLMRSVLMCKSSSTADWYCENFSGESVELINFMTSNPFRYPPQPLNTNLCNVRFCILVKANQLLGCIMGSLHCVTACCDALPITLSK